MKWLAGDKYYLLREDDKFRIAKALSGDRVLYTLFERNTDPRYVPYRIVRTVAAAVSDIKARNAALAELQDMAT